MGKVLVVDDDPTFRQIVCHAIRSEGHEAMAAASARQALDMIAITGNKPDLFLIDLMMPGINGLQLLLILKSDPVTSNIPVITWTATMSAEVTKQALAFEADVILYKTRFSMVELRRLVRKYVPGSVSRESEAAAAERVLVVEDDEYTRMAVEKHLAEAGYAVSHAENGWEALLVLDREEISLIVLDLVMPGMDGQTFLQIVRNSDKHSEVPVLIVTAFDVPDMIDRIKPLGVAGVLGKKPPLWDQLLPAVRKALQAA
jgi:CheY-like chemotaxis protein